MLLYLWALENTAQIPKCLFLLCVKPLRVYVTAPYSFLLKETLWVETSDVPPSSMANCSQDCVMIEVIVYYGIVLVYRLHWFFQERFFQSTAFKY